VAFIDEEKEQLRYMPVPESNARERVSFSSIVPGFPTGVSFLSIIMMGVEDVARLGKTYK